jgi:hypothetical protein
LDWWFVCIERGQRVKHGGIIAEIAGSCIEDKNYFVDGYKGAGYGQVVRKGAS